MQSSQDLARALSQFDGKSKVTLPKNIVGTENILTAGMISASNTVYILQYDYSLDNQTVALGSGSSIIFYGGSVNYGTLDYRNGNILPACDSFFGSSLHVLTNEPINIAWYGKKSGDSIDDIFDLLQGHTVIIPVGNYSCTKSGYVLEPGTMFIGEKVLNNDQTCCISFSPTAPLRAFIIGLNNNCGFKDITLWLTSTTYCGDLVRVDSAFWSDIPEPNLQPLRGQQYYIDNVYFFTSWMENGSDHYLATAFHVIIRDKKDNGAPLESYQQFLSYRQHFRNVEIKYFSIGIQIDLINYFNHTDEGVWCNSLHFFDIDMWVRNNGFVLETTNLKSWAVGRFIISGICLQAVGTHDYTDSCPYAFYAENGYNCMLDKINTWNDSKVAYVGGGEITLGQYVSDDANPLTVAGNGHIKTPQWIIHSAS